MDRNIRPGVEPFTRERVRDAAEVFEILAPSLAEELRSRRAWPRPRTPLPRRGGAPAAPRPRVPLPRPVSRPPRPAPPLRPALAPMAPARGWPRARAPGDRSPPLPPLPPWPARVYAVPSLPVEPFGEPGTRSDAERLRCVQACLHDDAEARAHAATTAAPALEPTEQEAAFELSLAAAIADPRSAGPGVYTLYRGGRRIYVGRSANLRRRLQQHLWCLTHLAVGATDYTVRLTPMRGASPAQLSRVEAATIARFGRRGRGGLLSNVKARELEQVLFEETGP